MEINHVIVAGVNKGIVPQARVMNSATDETSKHRRMEAERSLFYVVLTRARTSLLITRYGSPSPFIAETSQEMVPVAVSA